jgi:alkylhydroperoxidase/carboxymuconolactone decarboxylase family protein YurZ
MPAEESMKKVPGPFRKFVEAYPECGMSYEALAAASREAAGFAEKEAELVKLALAVGSRLEGAVHSHARRALEAGATAFEVRGVALLGLTTLGFPHTMMGTSWIEDVLREAGKGEAKAAKKGGKKAPKKAKKGK